MTGKTLPRPVPGTPFRDTVTTSREIACEQQLGLTNLSEGQFKSELDLTRRRRQRCDLTSRRCGEYICVRLTEVSAVEEIEELGSKL